jgi:hypothetical protein
MYAVISIHPRTLHISHRSFHKTYSDAVKAMKDEVTDYITNYKKYQTVIYINNKEEMKNHKDTKYFLKVSNKYPNRISIYENRTIVNEGFIYNTSRSQIEKIKVFYVTELSMPSEGEPIVVVDDNMNWINSIQRSSKNSYSNNEARVGVIEELKAKLQDRRLKID